MLGRKVRRVDSPKQAPFRVLGETADYLAVDKPAGLLVHPTKPGGPRTLWDGLRELLSYEVAVGGQVSLINRLDRETSGVVLIAKSASAARAAGLAMQRGEIRKEYLAFVFGHPDWEAREVDAPIIRQGEVGESPVYLKRCVHPDGAEARTKFETVSRLTRPDGRRFSLVRARPLTGRTHQIRVHLAHAGHPVLGDKLYADGEGHYLEFVKSGWLPAMESALWLPRHALHCGMMALGETSWSAPLAADLAAFRSASDELRT